MGEALIGRRYFEIAVSYSTIAASSSELGVASTYNQVSAGPNLLLGLARCTLCIIYFSVPGSKGDEWSKDKINVRKGTSKLRQNGVLHLHTP